MRYVYHYTSPEGILGILKSKALRFTDCQYLNDKGEFKYICEPFKKAYKRICTERGESVEKLDMLLENFIDSSFEFPYEYLNTKDDLSEDTSIDNLPEDTLIDLLKDATEDDWIPIKFYRYYILCTSINSDTANMWNYYVRNGVYKGYNVGIDRSFISNWFSNYRNDQIEFISGKVIYNETTQVKMIYSKLKELFFKSDERAHGHYFDDIIIKNFLNDLYVYLHEQKLFFKHPAFSSEEEYRFILKVDNDFSDNEDLSLDFRVGESGIITPYIEWRYTSSKKDYLFNQITLAPMIESSLAEESFNRFLDTTVHRRINIKQSSIKLRF